MNLPCFDLSPRIHETPKSKARHNVTIDNFFPTCERKESLLSHVFLYAVWIVPVERLASKVAREITVWERSKMHKKYPHHFRKLAIVISQSVFLAAAFLSGQSAALAQFPARPEHVVLVIEENKAFSTIIGNTNPATGAPYINDLAAQGAVFTSSFAIQHPSEPNYLCLFSGSNQGIDNDSLPLTLFTTPNLGSLLIAKGLTFGGYSETMPRVGYTGSDYSTVPDQYQYLKVCNPWVNWQGSPANAIPAASNMPFANFPSDYSLLPTVSFVVPNMQDNMHNEIIPQGDAWLKNHLDGYAQWAKTHNSLLIVTFDEDDFTPANQIPTIFFGPMVRPGQYSETINHYNVLRTIEDMYGLGYAGNSATVAPITDAFLVQHFMAWNKAGSGNWTESQWTNAAPAFPDSTADPALNTNYTVTVDGLRTARTILISNGMIDVPAATSLTVAAGTKVGAAGTLHVAGIFASQLVTNDGLLSITDGGQVTVSGIQGLGSTIVTGNAILTVGSLQQSMLTIGSNAMTSLTPPAVVGGVAPIPEPSTLMLLGMGSISLFAYAWRRRQA
jgi:phosphatidylinositol-3-phosphatase